MLIRTKHSIYELWPEENKVRKISKNTSRSHSIGKEWVTYDYMPRMPAVGDHLRLLFADKQGTDRTSVLTTSEIIEIVDQENFVWITQATDGDDYE